MQHILSQQPQYILSLKNYAEPIEVSHAIKNLKITRMIYGFIHNYVENNQAATDVFKYGQGADYEWQRGCWGARIYRQAGNIPGWTNMLYGPNGKEMRVITDDYINATGRIVHKNDVTILVYDFTNFVFPTESQFKRYLEKVENYLIEDYRNTYHKNPIGNIKDEAHAKNSSSVTDAQFNTLFNASPIL